MNPIVIALATNRLTQLVTKDELTRPVRQAVNAWAEGAEEFSVKDRVAALLGCDACVSVWAASAVLLASTNRPGRLLVGVLAASSAALVIKAVRDNLEEHPRGI